MVQHNEIKEILDAYWKGESTLEQEARLKAYFQQDDIDPSLLPYKDLFTFFVKEQEIHLPDESIQWPDESIIGGGKIRQMRPLRYWIGAAASIIVIVGFFWLIKWNTAVEPTAKDTYENPQLAWEQTKQALYFLSDKMDKGTEESLDKMDELNRLNIFNN